MTLQEFYNRMVNKWEDSKKENQSEQRNKAMEPIIIIGKN